jgi:hypothetical protein
MSVKQPAEESGDQKPTEYERRMNFEAEQDRADYGDDYAE